MADHTYLFNFAASHMGGGRKRLEAYARWFDDHGGAGFIVHPNCESLAAEFPANRYFIVRQSRWDRVFRDGAYLEAILRESGTPDLFFSYGIPIFRRVGRVDWFHVSNVLPFSWRGVPLSASDRLKFLLLGRRMRRYLARADVISAESKSSLSLLPDRLAGRFFHSVNGSDDELAQLKVGNPGPKKATAVVLGTYSYKAVPDAYRIFQALRERVAGLRLTVIGDPAGIPAGARGDRGVEAVGFLPRSEVIARLRGAMYYLSATRIENSYNAAAEGIFLADESYISDIGPHRELLDGERYERLLVPGVASPLLRVRRESLTGRNLKSWETVVGEIISEVRGLLGKQEGK